VLGRLLGGSTIVRAAAVVEDTARSTGREVRAEKYGPSLQAERQRAPPPGLPAAMAGLEEFQRAILLTFDPGADPAQRREANASLDALKAAAEGWRFCFQAFVASEVPQVKFWCLQTLVTLVSDVALSCHGATGRARGWQ
jgi:hypothetical protein